MAKTAAAKREAAQVPDKREPAEVIVAVSPALQVEVEGDLEKSVDPQRIRAAIQKAFDPLAAYRDPWKLLNATEQELREAAGTRRYAPEDIDELVNMVAALQTLYRGVATGDPKALAQVFPEAEAKLRQALRRLFSGIFETGFFLNGVQVRRGLRRVEGQGNWPTAMTLDVGEALTDLLYGLETATPSTVYACEWCGRIGPARRSDKRHCSDSCRARASRRRRRGY